MVFIRAGEGNREGRQSYLLKMVLGFIKEEDEGAGECTCLA
ncbi:hypothetical protein Hanom_Chr09g00816591 [Helianthus anomalus]